MHVLTFAFFPLAACLVVFALSAEAQSTSSVSGPEVSPGWQTEYRFGMTGEHAGETLTHRLHVSRAVADGWRLRGIISFDDSPGRGSRFAYYEADVMWQFAGRSEQDRYKSALRVDLRQNELKESQQIGLNWINQWALHEDWRLRLMGSVDKVFNTPGSGGIILETRASLGRRVSDDIRLEFDMFNRWGNTQGGLGGFEDQNHTAGLVLSGKGPAQMSWALGALAGLSDGAPDGILQLRLGKGF